MTRGDFAEILEGFATSVERIPGVSRTRPHAFAEAKLDLVGRMRREARELRTVVAPPARAVPPINPGIRSIGGRAIPVVRRGA